MRGLASGLEEVASSLCKGLGVSLPERTGELATAPGGVSIAYSIVERRLSMLGPKEHFVLWIERMRRKQHPMAGYWGAASAQPFVAPNSVSAGEMFQYGLLVAFLEQIGHSKKVSGPEVVCSMPLPAEPPEIFGSVARYFASYFLLRFTGSSQQTP